MTPEQLTMHQAFLAEIMERRLRLQKEIDEMMPVEQYHRKLIDEFQTLKGASNGHATSATKPGTITNPLLFASRSEACEIALKELGGRAKTQAIADWLRERDFGSELDGRVFHNTCYTAMSRKDDTFEKSAPGEWRLIN